MPIIMNRQYSISGNYTDEQKAAMAERLAAAREKKGKD